MQDKIKAPGYFAVSLPVCQYLDLLLAQVCGIVEKHTDVSVLEACARLVSTLTSDNYTFSSRACRAFSQLLDALAECFHSYLDDLLQVGGACGKEKKNRYCLQHLSMMVTVEQKLEVKKIVKSYDQDKNWTFFFFSILVLFFCCF